MAKGRDKLKKLREIAANRDKLPPSRNILIAHSMGGVASREYVQGTGYNNDVDKIITLDSPHEGTGSLEMLLDLRENDLHRLAQAGIKSAMAYVASGLLLLTLAKDISTAEIALYSLIPAAAALAGDAAVYGTGIGLAKYLDKHYERKDPLTPYINPKNSNCDISGICNLRDRPYTNSLPMMRLLYGTNSMTFSDPAKIDGLNYVIPKGLTTAYYS